MSASASKPPDRRRLELHAVGSVCFCCVAVLAKNLHLLRCSARNNYIHRRPQNGARNIFVGYDGRWLSLVLGEEVDMMLNS